jgi:hypothetical protein
VGGPPALGWGLEWFGSKRRREVGLKWVEVVGLDGGGDGAHCCLRWGPQIMDGTGGGVNGARDGSPGMVSGP